MAVLVVDWIEMWAGAAWAPTAEYSYPPAKTCGVRFLLYRSRKFSKFRARRQKTVFRLRRFWWRRDLGKNFSFFCFQVVDFFSLKSRLCKTLFPSDNFFIADTTSTLVVGHACRCAHLFALLLHCGKCWSVANIPRRSSFLSVCPPHHHVLVCRCNEWHNRAGRHLVSTHALSSLVYSQSSRELGSGEDYELRTFSSRLWRNHSCQYRLLLASFSEMKKWLAPPKKTHKIRMEAKNPALFLNQCSCFVAATLSQEHWDQSSVVPSGACTIWVCCCFQFSR